MISEKIENLVQNALKELGIEADSILLDHPNEVSHGDYSTNAAMVCAKKSGMKDVLELAAQIAWKISEQNDPDIEKVEAVLPGFINFYLSKAFYERALTDINTKGESWGKNSMHKGKKVMVEYTDPNPFKAFHIGHLMANTIGEAMARLIEFSGADVVRANYQGDVGPHVAKAIWGLQNGHGSTKDTTELGIAYAAGANAYEENKEAINVINKAIYEGSSHAVNALYEEGRQVSLDHFEEIYELLGTKFDHYFFESKVWYDGVEIVRKNIGTIFQESEGAVVFHAGELDKTLHTRVFINSEGIPTYEAKELGLVYKKKEVGDFDMSITITAVEQKEYFKVVKKAIEQIDPKLAENIIHISHGMMRLPSGKMSSRTGDVITAEDLIAEAKKKVLDIESEREIEDKEGNAEIIAIAALKYMILRQAAHKDTMYDLERAVSFEGDSGPYLQYAYTRAISILEKANKDIESGCSNKGDTTLFEKLLYRFPSVVQHSSAELEPHHVTNYLTELAGAFNSFYANEKIIGSENESYNLALTHAFSLTMKQGLYILGMKAPQRM